MSEVEFDENSIDTMDALQRRRPGKPKSFLMRIAMRFGAKTEAQANKAFIAVILICFAVILFNLLPVFGVGRKAPANANVETPPPSEANSYEK
jgi:hypothetical protein